MFKVTESYIDETRGYRLRDDIVYKTDLYETRGELFRAFRREYGRCISKVYVDAGNTSPEDVGWVFEKKVQYEDTGDSVYGRGSTPEYFIRHVWVSVKELPLCVLCIEADSTTEHASDDGKTCECCKGVNTSQMRCIGASV